MDAAVSDALTFAAFFLGGFLLALALAGIVIKVLIDFHRDERTTIVAERGQWRSERRELLNRVQHPNLVPTGTERQPRQRDPEVAERLREWASVGRVTAGVEPEELP
jgi:hypothetical protein